MNVSVLLPKDLSKYFPHNLAFAKYAEDLRKITLVPIMQQYYINRAIMLMTEEVLDVTGN